MTTAFFYQQPTPLDREQHKQLKIKPLADAGFAANAHVVPLVGIEFPEACLEYPIVFGRTDDDNWMALAVTGLAAGENLFIGENRQWSGRYVPASIRRYPFILINNGANPYGVAIDLGSANVGEKLEDGEDLFDAAGEPAPMLQSTMNLLADFQGQAGATQAMIKRLVDADLLVQSDMQVTLADGRAANLAAVWIVDENRLRNLPDATAAAWFRSGDLALVYGHLLSLRNLPLLLQRRAALKTLPEPPAQSAPAANAAKTKKKD